MLGYSHALSRFKRELRWWAALAACVIVWAVGDCARAQVSALSDDMDRESLRAALRQSVGYLEKLPRERIVGEQPRRITAGQLLDSLQAFDRVLDHWGCWTCLVKALQARFELVPSSSAADSAEVLFTGYYQPLIEASLTPTEEYRYPLYGVPADLVVAEQVTLTPTVTIEKVTGRATDEGFPPYYSRREIDADGTLRGRGIEIAWVKDPVDIFFLQIQGSGLLQLSDGRRLQIGYAAQNGWPYRSIGRLLIDQEKIPKEEMSMQRLRQYLAEHAEERDEILFANESYVFFRLLDTGPLGSLAVPLTPGRSIATDSRLFPKGALAFLATEKPVIDSGGGLSGWRPIARFVLNQDTGGAIRGLQRADIFFGAGESATAEAGYMNRPGRLYFLLLKEAPHKRVPLCDRRLANRRHVKCPAPR